MASIVFQSLTADMAAALVSAIKAVYGDSYPMPEFYSENRIVQLLNDELLYSEVALNECGEIVGMLNTLFEARSDITADSITGMVAEAYRGEGILGAIGGRMSEVYAKLNLSGIQLYAITLHTITQRSLLEDGVGVVTGLLPAHFSNDMKAKGFDRFHGRVGVVPVFMKLKQLPPLDVFVPYVYQSIVSRFYADAQLDRRVILADKSVSEVETQCDVSYNDKTKGRLVVVHRIGYDFEECLCRILGEDRHHMAELVYLDIPLTDPGSMSAVDVANEQGFFYGALIPARRGTDRLRLQRVSKSLFAFSEMKLYPGETETYLDYVAEDADRVVR